MQASVKRSGSAKKEKSVVVKGSAGLLGASPAGEALPSIWQQLLLCWSAVHEMALVGAAVCLQSALQGRTKQVLQASCIMSLVNHHW